MAGLSNRSIIFTFNEEFRSDLLQSDLLQSDLLRWKTFALHWNRAALTIDPNLHYPVVVMSDVSGLLGCGLYLVVAV